MFYLLFASSTQLTIGSIDATDFGEETCGLPPDFRPLRYSPSELAKIIHANDKSAE
jgi:hypothetical protein